MTANAVEYKRNTRHIVRRAIREKGWKISPKDKVGIRVVIVPDRFGKFDIDNRWKLIQDVLEESGIVHNDSQIYHINITKTEPDKSLDYAERCSVDIRILSEDFGRKNGVSCKAKANR